MDETKQLQSLPQLYACDLNTVRFREPSAPPVQLGAIGINV